MVAVCDEEGSVTFWEMRPQVKLLDDGVLDKATVPAKPPRAVTVIVDVADPPTSTPAGEDAVISKSWTLTVVLPTLEE
jgi:hypothetical protein